ncbi:patatin-like phospholipase family protein [Bradyrhizobium sp.]
MPGYGIVFSGGGALAAWEVGCYRAIRAHHDDTPPAIVSGASSGALNAAGVCIGMQPATLKDVWARMKNADVYRARFDRWTFTKLAARAGRIGPQDAVYEFLSGQQSVFDASPLVETLRRELKDFDQPFEQSRVRLAVSATNLAVNRKQVFYKMPPQIPLPGNAATSDVDWRQIRGIESLIDALVGSTALPILFPPWTHFFDGGIMLNQPISPALRIFEPDILYVVIPSAENLGQTGNLIEIGSTLLTVWLRVSLDLQIERIKLINDVIRPRTAKRKIRLCVIRPSQDLGRLFGVSLLQFGQKVDELEDAGFKAANSRIAIFRDDNEETWY